MTDKLEFNNPPTFLRRVACAAIRAEDGDFIVGVRHYSEDMCNQIEARRDGEKFMHRSGDDQGFVDNYGRYMTRKEAYGVAILANQLPKSAWSKEGVLYSESLY